MQLLLGISSCVSVEGANLRPLYVISFHSPVKQAQLLKYCIETIKQSQCIGSCHDKNPAVLVSRNITKINVFDGYVQLLSPSTL